MSSQDILGFERVVMTQFELLSFGFVGEWELLGSHPVRDQLLGVGSLINHATRDFGTEGFWSPHRSLRKGFIGF